MSSLQKMLDAQGHSSRSNTYSSSGKSGRKGSHVRNQRWHGGGSSRSNSRNTVYAHQSAEAASSSSPCTHANNRAIMRSGMFIDSSRHI